MPPKIPGVRTSLLLAALWAASAHAQPGAQPRVARLEHHRLDLDGDGLADDLWLYPSSDPGEPGAYRRLQLKLSRSGTHTLEGSWDAQRQGNQSFTGNAVPSHAVFIGRFPRGGTLMFLRGEDVGCCEQGLEIYRITATSVEPYFKRPEFVFARPLTLSRATNASLIGQESLSETVGTSAPDAAVATNYEPILVYRLVERPQLDTAASIRATRAALGGFAGLTTRLDVIAVVRRDKTRYLWDEARKRPLP
jgi:hypothetical protein